MALRWSDHHDRHVSPGHSRGDPCRRVHPIGLYQGCPVGPAIFNALFNAHINFLANDLLAFLEKDTRLLRLAMQGQTRLHTHFTAHMDDIYLRDPIEARAALRLHPTPPQGAVPFAAAITAGRETADVGRGHNREAQQGAAPEAACPGEGCEPAE